MLVFPNAICSSSKAAHYAGRSSRRQILPFGSLLLLIVSGFVCGFSGCEPKGNSGTGDKAAVALGSALEGLEQGKSEEIAALLKAAEKDPKLAQWVKYGWGKYYEAAGDAPKAAQYYGSIAENSAAAFDGRVALLRLATLNPNVGISADALGKVLSRVEIEAKALGRRDVYEDLNLLAAERSEKEGNLLEAASRYKEIRRTLPQGKLARQARVALDKLRAEHADKAGLLSVASLQDEVRARVAERDFNAAAKFLDAAKRDTTERSNAWYELMLLDADVQRGLGNTARGDELLSQLAKEAPPSIAEEALSKRIKNLWNGNKVQEALAASDQLFSRFPNSRFLDEGRYVRARMYEDARDIDQARKAYREVIDKSKDPLSVVRSLRRLAWLRLLVKDYAGCETEFKALRQYLEPKVNAAQSSPPPFDKIFIVEPPESVAARRESQRLFSEYEHAVYWQSACAAQAHHGQAPVSGSAAAAPLVPPSSYYNLLLLEASQPQWTDHVPAFYQSGEGSPEGRCLKPSPKWLVDLLEVLAEGGASELARREIDWYFYSTSGGAKQPSARAELEALLSRLALYERFAGPDYSTPVAARLLGAPEFKAALEGEPECRNELFRVAFPLPYMAEYKAASEDSGVPLELLLAVSRTESFFKADAVSSSGAKGLMQLMEKTAEQEGLKEEEDLFDPAVNIRLGAKHLARLRDRYQGTVAFVAAAYNAGADAVDRWRQRAPETSDLEWTELIGYPETYDYVRRVRYASDIYRVRLMMSNVHNGD